MQCINSLLTLEHLSLICQNKSRLTAVDSSLGRLSMNSRRRKSSSHKNSKSSLTEHVE